ncbi:hypothetical protein F5148DRAFT_1145685 [Russula earlei]|uniref:Uncharacterized protein n=1 Tax=Russula earlei TaxID=71964 RepID=A0ACC0UND6_9AGAM|nr:hypothetical protein F5148DRAFT_1145685 [Russula earlei]
MKLPSSSSLILASLAVSSSTSSLSALAAPAGDGHEDTSSLIPVRSDDAATQSNNHLQDRGIVPPELIALLRPVFALVGVGGSKDARADFGPNTVLDQVSSLTGNLNHGERKRAEEDETNDTPQNTPTQPSPAPPEASSSPAAGPNDGAKPPVALPVQPPVPLPSLPVQPPVKLPVKRDPLPQLPQLVPHLTPPLPISPPK